MNGIATIENIRPSHLPGECVSIDQMEITTIGFIAQSKGTQPNYDTGFFP
jgi:hypothetical protein